MKQIELKSKLSRIEAGIDAIKKIIVEAPTQDEQKRLAELYASEIMLLQRAYRNTRSQFDILYFTYEYFSEERNKENSGNLIPKGVFIDDAPAFHHELCSKLEELALEKPTKKIAWSVPRGHGKSMFLSNIKPIHAIIFSLRKYILIISETEGMAQKFVEYVANQLKFNKKLIDDFGVHLHPSKILNEQDNVEGFISTSGIKVQSASMGKQLRGARHGAFRPDLIILDDLESAKNTNTKELREKNLHWYNSVIVPIGTPERTGIIYMGTLVHGQGLLPNILQRADYDAKIYSAIVNPPERIDLWEQYENKLREVDNPNRLIEADLFYFDHKDEMDKGAETLWMQRFNYADMVKKKVEVGSRAFASEYLNKPADNDSLLFNPDHFTYYDDKDLFDQFGRRLQLDIFSFWDIAIGKNSKSDYNAIVTIGRHKPTGVIYVLDAYAKKIPMHQALEVAVEKIQEHKPKMFGVETVQAQYDMFRQLQQRCFNYGMYGTRVKPINPKGKKEDRIEILEPLFEAGMIRIKKQHRLLIEQLEHFPTHDHDDLPDALASVVDMAGNRVRRTYFYKPEGM
jgi:predicted phage terminase large subunit-like protein